MATQRRNTLLRMRSCISAGHQLLQRHSAESVLILVMISTFMLSIISDFNIY